MDISSIFGSVASMASSVFQNAWNNQVRTEQNAFNAYQSEVTRDWSAAQSQLNYERNLEADSTKYQRSVQDMAAAGLNPALMMSGGTGISAPVMGSAASGSTASASGASPAVGFDLSSVAQFMNALTQKRLSDSQARVQNATADKLESETIGQNIENTYSEEFHALQNESLRVSNDLGRSQRNLVDSNVDKTFSEIAKNDATISELLSRKELNEASTSQILELLPYSIAYTEAQTASAKAMAGLNFVVALKERKLIDNGYYDALCDSLHLGNEQLSMNNKAQALSFANHWDVDPATGESVTKNKAVHRLKVLLGQCADLFSPALLNGTGVSWSSSKSSSSSTTDSGTFIYGD